MIIDVSKGLTDLQGLPIRQDDNPVTLEAILTQALLAPLQEDQNLSGSQKVKLFNLALKISGQTEVDLSAEDISLIKERVAKVFSILVVGRVWSTIDPVKE